MLIDWHDEKQQHYVTKESVFIIAILIFIIIKIYHHDWHDEKQQDYVTKEDVR